MTRPARDPRLARLLAKGLLGALLLSTFDSIPRADRLVTLDKRIIECLKARKVEGGYELTFENGVVHCGEDQVVSVEVEGDMSDYEPQNDREREFLEKGYVRYQDRWMSKAAYQSELNDEAEERRERLAELEAHAHFYDGWVEETKHFIIQTNTSPELLAYYAELLEAYYDLMDKQVGINPTPKLRRTKMKVNIFKSRDEFHELTGMGGGVAGFFSFQEESLNFYHDYDDPEVSDWVALHECTHLLTYLIEPQSRPRIWVNEGVADFFGSSTITRDKRGRIEIEPGKLQVDRILTVQQAIKDGDYVPLEELFRVEKSGFTAFEYAHSWSFVYFLNNANRKYQSGFNKFFEKHYTIPKDVEYEWQPFPNQQGTAKVLAPEEVRRLLLEAIKIDDNEVADLEKEWLAYIEGIEVDAPVARFKRAYRVVRSYNTEQFDQALEDLNFAIENGLEEPRAYWTRAMLKYRANDSAGAEADLLKAIEMSPLDARFRATLAGMLAGYGMSFGGIVVIRDSEWELSGDEADIERAREQYGLAHELDPDNDGYRLAYEDYLEAYERWRADQDG